MTEKRKRGRPTLYSLAILQKTKDYLLNYEKEGHPFPSLVGLSRVLGIASSALQRWQNDENKQDFKVTLSKIRDEQHLRALHMGFSGESNTAITKLLLHNFGYSDKQEVEQSGQVKVIGITQSWNET